MEKKPRKSNKKNLNTEGKLALLLTLNTLLKKARHKTKQSELEFLIVNQTHNLVSYRQAVYWEFHKNKCDIKSISGLAQIDKDGPYLQWLKKVIEKLASKHQKNNDEKLDSFVKIFTIKKEHCDSSDQKNWDEWASKNVTLVFFLDKKGHIFSGLWIDRDKSFNELEHVMLEDLTDGYAAALQSLNASKKYKFGRKSSSGLGFKIILLLILSSLFIPVRMSSVAPAEIVAQKPFTVTVPIDGVIDEVLVSPGQIVQKGDLLIQMDSTSLENKAIMAKGELDASEIALQKTQRESLADRTKLAEIEILKAQVEQKRAEYNFAQEFVERSEIIAERDGIVIFSDPNSLRGKPVQTGEQTMLIADPQEYELLIRIPINQMISINETVPARFFLNVNPFQYQEIEYSSVGYQATADADGLMTYKVRGDFINKDEDMRIGWIGTGKVYGEWTILAVNILRRPIVAFRSKFGL